MAPANYFGEELQEKRDEQQSDMHPVNIGIGSDNHFVVAQIVHAFFYIQSSLQQVKLLVLVHHFFCQPVGVERFPFQAKYGL